MEAYTKSPAAMKKLLKVKAGKTNYYRDDKGNLWKEDGSYHGRLGFPDGYPGRPKVLGLLPLTTKEAVEILRHGKRETEAEKGYQGFLDYQKEKEGESTRKERMSEKLERRGVTKAVFADTFARFMGFGSMKDLQEQVPSERERKRLAAEHYKAFEALDASDFNLYRMPIVRKTKTTPPPSATPVVSEGGAVEMSVKKEIQKIQKVIQKIEDNEDKEVELDFSGFEGDESSLKDDPDYQRLLAQLEAMERD